MPTRPLLSLLSHWFVMVLFALAVLSGRCLAQGFPPVTPEDLKMTSEPNAPGAPAIILYREVDRDDSVFPSYENNYLRIKVLTEEGRKFANVEISFVKAIDDVVDVHARSIKPDGTVVEFDGQVLEKTIAKARSLEYAAKMFTLSDVQVGGIIEYRYTMKEHLIHGSRWILSDQLFTRDARFSLKPFQSRFRRESLRWTWQGIPPGSGPKEANDHSMHMEVENIPAFQVEDYMPPPNELKARVDFIYEGEYLEHDADQYWRHVAKNRNEALERFIDKRRAMEQAVGEIVLPGDPAEVKLRKIYDRVQRIRNRSYELLKTTQELKRDKDKPDESVEDVWKRGYGSEWQLNWLYLALVRAAGFDAYAVSVSDRKNYFFTPKTMENRKLDATAVLVKLDGKDLYFSPGAAFAPYGMLAWSETGVPALRLDKEGGTWVKTTLPKSSESRIERVAKLRLTDNGNLEGGLKVTYTGLEAMYHRQDVRNADAVTRKKFLEDRIKNQIPATTEVELVNTPDWSDSETPLVAEFNIAVRDWASNAGKRTVIPAAIFTAVEKHTFEHTNRVHPIYVDYPYEKEDDVTIELPEGWQVSSMPPAQANDGHVVAYSLKVDKNANTLHMTRKLTWDFLVLETKYYPALRAFFQAVRTGDDQQVILQPAASSASN